MITTTVKHKENYRLSIMERMGLLDAIDAKLMSILILLSKTMVLQRSAIFAIS